MRKVHHVKFRPVAGPVAAEADAGTIGHVVNNLLAGRDTVVVVFDRRCRRVLFPEPRDSRSLALIEINHPVSPDDQGALAALVPVVFLAFGPLFGIPELVG